MMRASFPSVALRMLKLLHLGMSRPVLTSSCYKQSTLRCFTMVQPRLSFALYRNRDAALRFEHFKCLLCTAVALDLRY